MTDRPRRMKLLHSAVRARSWLALGALLALALAGFAVRREHPVPEVRVRLEAPVAEVSPRFLSVAVDMAQVVGGRFWDPAGGVGVLGEAHVPVYDFGRSRLRALAAELAPAYLRVGGSDADRVYYDLGPEPRSVAPPGFDGVLTAAQLDGLFDFARALDFELVITLGAGPGVRDAEGAWTGTSARALVQYAVDRDAPVGLWELGNEWNAFLVIHGVGGAVAPAQMARDFATARALLGAIDPDLKLGGPSSAYWPLVGEVNDVSSAFIEAGGLSTLDVMTWHYYPQQSERCPLAVLRAQASTLLDPERLDEVARWAAVVERGAARAGLPVWLGESGHAQCGGQRGVSDRFVSSFWWLDQLGLLARRGEQVVIRQTLSGSDYGLVDDVDLVPRPDYWASVLWKRLMGRRALAVEVASVKEVRAYAHCTPERPGAVTTLLVHLGREGASTLALPGLRGSAELYRLTADSLLAPEVRLNGRTLRDDAGALPSMRPERIEEGDTITLPPLSITFLVHPDAAAPACQ